MANMLQLKNVTVSYKNVPTVQTANTPGSVEKGSEDQSDGDAKRCGRICGNSV